MECSLRRALQGTLTILTRVQPKDLDASTPCASWDVRALVNHFVGTARWWAATVSGDDGVADAVLRNLATMEQFTHGWDLARATGQPADLDPVLAACLLGRVV